MRGALLTGLCALALLVLAAPAQAYWQAAGAGAGSAVSATMPTANTPTATVSGRNVTVQWTQNSFQGSPLGAYAGGGYTLKRYAPGSMTPVTPNAACASTISGASATLACTEAGVPAGDWQYSVRPVLNTFTGQDSANSATVTVAAPLLTFSSTTTITSLPTTLSGSIANFTTGQSVTFRLDDPTTGTTLTGSISPTPVPDSGSATVSVTIPAGTSDGAHTVYAVGSQGDSAGAAITVSSARVPVAQSASISAWQVSDQSSGTATDVSDALSFEDFVTVGGIARASTFDTAKYRSLRFAGPLPTGYSTSAVNFNFTFDSGGSGTSCFYFDVRAATTGLVLATKGSAATPVGCISPRGGALTTTTPLPEVTTSAIANDLEIRVYETNSGGTATNTDLTSVSGAMGPGATKFTLYATTSTDTSGASPVVRPWSLATLDGNALQTSSVGWATTFATTRYLKATFPAYVPPEATGVSATFDHSYKGLTTATSCYYFEVYNAATLVSTHGSSATPYSCNATTSYRMDTVALPAVDTVAEANNLSVRLYFKNSANQAADRRTYHDGARIRLNYTA